ncbi:MAG: class A beta-lactamase-related serine hydrolase [Myxococcales bacterium]|nr:class A beta-lactamase-related serine hydrolase [Myxococcales bacterium]
MVRGQLDAVRDLLRSAVGTVFPAAQLLVCDGGSTQLDEAVGDCTTETRFDVASLTKALVTTTLVMRLGDAGRLPLDHELRPGVTVRHALAHAGGLPASQPLHELAAAGEPEDLRRAVIEAARTEPLETPPGTRSVYSDLGFILLGDAVEQAAGTRLDLQWAEVAEELGIAASFDPDPAGCAPTRPSPGPEAGPAEELSLAGTVHDDNALAMEGVAGHAGLFATAREVGVVARALISAWCDCTQSWCDRIKKPIAAPATVRAFWTGSGVPGSTWCLGWDRPSPGGSQAGALWPRDGVGHLGFTGCSLWIDPPRGRFVVLLSNRVLLGDGNEAIKTFRPALHDAVVQALARG